MSVSTVFTCNGCGTKAECHGYNTDVPEGWIVDSVTAFEGSPLRGGAMIHVCGVGCWLKTKREQLDAIEAEHGERRR